MKNKYIKKAITYLLLTTVSDAVLCTISSSVFASQGIIPTNESKNTICREVTISTEAKTSFENFVNDEENSLITNYNNGNYKAVMQQAGDKLREILLNDKNTFNLLVAMGQTGTPGIIHIKGLPVDSVIPEDGNINERVGQKGKVSECLILGMANVMGCVALANPNEQEGRIIHNVAPIPGASCVSSRGSNSLYWHTENAYEETPPDFLMLYGLVTDENVPTGYSSIDEFLSNFDSEEINLMTKSCYRICAESGYSTSEGTFALLSTYNENKTRLRVHDYRQVVYMEDTDKERASALLTKMAEILLKTTPNNILINSGEAIIFNNGWGIEKATGVMHCRGNSITNPRRWLQRGYFHRTTENNG